MDRSPSIQVLGHRVGQKALGPADNGLVLSLADILIIMQACQKGVVERYFFLPVSREIFGH